jgi:hypothetical protein
LPLIAALEKVSPVVALALKRGAGSFCLVSQESWGRAESGDDERANEKLAHELAGVSMAGI